MKTLANSKGIIRGSNNNTSWVVNILTGTAILSVMFCGCAIKSPTETGGATPLSSSTRPHLTENPEADSLVKAAQQCCMEAQYQDAVKKCDDAIAIQPDNVMAYCVKGRSLHDMQRDQAAIQAFDSALKVDRRSIFALAFKASTLQSLGRMDESKAMLREISVIPPKSHDEWDCLSRGCALHIGEDYQGALDKYNAALMIDSNNAEVYFNRGMAYKMLKQDGEAVNDFESALKLYSRYAEVYNELASLLGTQKRFDLAIENYSQAIQINPNYAIVYSNRGLAFAAKPNPDYAAAREDWNTAVKLDSSGIAGQSAQSYLIRLRSMNIR